jgi:hypothetical protein
VCAKIDFGGPRQPAGAGASARPVLPLTPDDLLDGALTLVYMLRRLMDPPEPGYGSGGAGTHPALSRALTRMATAPRQQADQPAAKSCSGLVPAPVDPGGNSLTPNRLSELRDTPSRPPVV